ncbi:dTDP-4-dehydrorhamnose reductase [Corynebacterium ulceribovis]|uniref:dTDP-4-dehydrorhamnose reductase n=1 Tax=Corynebacterium ulceribovis TaxID=487732 RepID=UPI00036A457D|nr:dTDP-4-dehydrorhamnose reductase [Corynebacterium ulceribovis]
MRIIIVGAAGQLGTALRRTAPTGLNVVELTRSDVDISDERQVLAHPAFVGADVVINCAAYTAVDNAEKPEQRDIAFAVNALGAELLARRAAAEGAFVVQVSTDYVFGSDTQRLAARSPWPVDAPTVPETVYGASKLAGERAVRAACPHSAIVRTAWVFSGPTQPDAPCFVTTMMRLAASGRDISVVNDQFGNPTFVDDLARGIWALAAASVPGVFHATGSGVATWYDLAVATFELIDANPRRISPVTSEEYPRPAPRPKWSVLDDSAWLASGFEPLPSWRDGLRRSLEVG